MEKGKGKEGSSQLAAVQVAAKEKGGTSSASTTFGAKEVTQALRPFSLFDTLGQKAREDLFETFWRFRAWRASGLLYTGTVIATLFGYLNSFLGFLLTEQMDAEGLGS